MRSKTTHNGLKIKSYILPMPRQNFDKIFMCFITTRNSAGPRSKNNPIFKSQRVFIQSFQLNNTIVLTMFLVKREHNNIATNHRHIIVKFHLN